MGIGPSTKETSLHHFRDPLLDVVSQDTDVDLMGIVIVGTPDDNVDKIYISGTATVKESDETVQVYGEAEKKNLTGHTEADGDYFKGGDQLVIQLNPDKIEGSTAGVEKPGVSITISGFNAESLTANVNAFVCAEPIDPSPSFTAGSYGTAPAV